MRLRFLLVMIISISSCRNEIKETINLLDFVPQNSIGVVQINDPLMLDNTFKRLPFLKGLAKLDFNLHKNISAVIPETKSQNSILILTPQGKSDIAISYVYRDKESDSTNYKILESFVYNSVKVNVSVAKERKVYTARIRDINIKSNSQLVLENCIRNIQNNQKGIQDDHKKDEKIYC